MHQIRGVFKEILEIRWRKLFQRVTSPGAKIHQPALYDATPPKKTTQYYLIKKKTKQNTTPQPLFTLNEQLPIYLLETVCNSNKQSYSRDFKGLADRSQQREHPSETAAPQSAAGAAGASGQSANGTCPAGSSPGGITPGPGPQHLVIYLHVFYFFFLHF